VDSWVGLVRDRVGHHARPADLSALISGVFVSETWLAGLG